MRFFIKSLLLLVFATACSTISLIPPMTLEAAAETAKFAHKGLEKDAERYERFLQSHWKPGKRRAVELIAMGGKSMAKDPRAAAGSYAMAVVAEPANATAWIGLAEALLAITPDPSKGSERFDIPVNASGAAYIAYERATATPAKARALAVLGSALKRRAFWRPAIESLKASISLVADAGVQATLDALAAEHGFRMTDYRTDSEAQSPRVCLQFSEALARGQVDFSKYVVVDGRDPTGVSPENTQLCIDGLKHGERYEIQLKAGLPSAIGETLAKNTDIAVYVPDRKPAVRFTGRAYVLPSRGQQGIPVVSLNTNEVEVEIYRVGDRLLAPTLQSGDFDRQLSTWDVETIQNRTGEKIYSGTLPVTSKLNAEVTTAVPVGDAVGTLKPGAYVMIAKPARNMGANSYNVATQWFIVSDLGLTAFSGGDGIHAFVRSLSETTPVAGSKVRLVARNNEELGSAITDARGYVRFAPGLAKGEGGLQPAMLVAEKNDGTEYAFLDLTTAAFDLSDRGVSGREPPGPVDGYLFAERGVYRPGEAVHITGLARSAAGTADATPLTMIVSRPDGVEHRRLVLADQGLGGRSASLNLSTAAMTGTWRARLHTDPSSPAIAQTSFLVEDFMPERLDMTLTAPEGSIAPEETKSIRIAGRYLYGPPAADLALEGDIVVKPSTTGFKGFEDYSFGLADEIINAVRAPLQNLVNTSADGTADVPVTLPPIPDTAKPLQAEVLVRLREPGGRGIERTVKLPVQALRSRIGIKSRFKSDELGDENKTATFDVVHLDADGKRAAAAGATWQLMRLDTTWQWYSRDGSWSYEAVTFTRKVASGTIDIAADTPATVSADVGYGRYRLEVSTSGAAAAASSVAFNAGWYVSAENPDSPEALDVALDKPSYKAGEMAKLRIASKYAGTALIAVLGNGLEEMREIAVPKGGTEVSIPVASTWGAGAYVTALMYRPMDEALKRMPGRALGLAWLSLDQSDRTIRVALEAPGKIRSGETLSIPVTLTGLAAGEAARLTVAAVDIGVLNVTRYKSPAPEGWFYAQRRLGTEIRDFYGRLIDGMRAERGTLRSGGDGDGGVGMQGSPPVEEIVSLYSGIVTVGADGKATVAFDMPEFNGSVRLMAVAWSENKLGSAQQDVIVRDPVALTLTSPRFMTLGDAARLTVDMHNVEGAAGAYQLTIERSPAEAEHAPRERIADQRVELGKEQKRIERVSLKPTAVGLFAYDVRVTGQGVDVHRRLTLDVKPPAGDIKRTTVASIAPNGGSLTLSRDLVQDLIASRTRINLSVGPNARLDVPGLLTQLDRYPYGCAEQTVSRALPLVYANLVASQIGIGTDKALKERVQTAIDHVFTMQDSSGAFGIWGPSSADLWLTAYVADFLTRTKEQGYAVRPQPFASALDRLQNFIAYAQDFEKGGEDRAYALYVLARNARAPIGELRYLADTRIDRFATPLAKAQIGAALAMMGDKSRAERAFAAAIAHLDQDQQNISRGDYGSSLRDGAALITLASETGIAKTEAARLVDVIAKAQSARSHTSTQEQAWMLLAANALATEAAESRLRFDGAPMQGPLFRPLTPAEIGKDGGLVIANDGEAAVDVVVSVIGAALTPEPAVSKGFSIERSYYTLDGKAVDVASASGGTAKLSQNDRLVAVVKVTTKEKGGRVLLVDRLPAGLEIENPRLVQSGDIKALAWLSGTISPEHSEFRDDRFVAAFNLFSGTASNGEGERTATAAYIVRAVTPGTFVHPAATVEDMYRPEYYARTAAGTLAISGKE